jgi:hypothetical protein
MEIGKWQNKEARKERVEELKIKKRKRKDCAEAQSTQRFAEGERDHNEKARAGKLRSKKIWGKELFGEPAEGFFAEGDFEETLRGEDIDGQAAVPEGDAKSELALTL